MEPVKTKKVEKVEEKVKEVPKKEEVNILDLDYEP